MIEYLQRAPRILRDFAARLPRTTTRLLLGLTLAGSALVTQAQTFTGLYDVSEVSDGTSCGFGQNTYQYPLDIRHHGDVVSIHEAGKSTAMFAGIFGGGRLQLKGAFDASDGWRVNTALDWQFASSRFTGTYVWTYSKAGQTCLDTSTYSATRRTTTTPATLAKPTLSLQQSNNKVTAQWTAVAGATSYTLYYAPYPAGSPLAAIDLGTQRSMTQTLPTGARFYVAIGANGNNASSPLSNVELLTVGSTAATTPNPAPTPAPTPAPVASVVLSTSTAFSMVVNDTRDLTATLRDSQGSVLSDRSVQWSSSNTSVISTSANGSGTRLTARTAGTATITATSEGRSASVAITVTAAATGGGTDSYSFLQSLRITNQSEYVSVFNWAPNQTLFIQADGTLTTGGALPTAYKEGMRWTTSNPAVARLIGDGAGTSVSVLYTGKGTTTITVTLGSKSARVVLGLGENVQPVQSVSFTPPFALRVGECQEINASVEDGGGLSLTGRTFSWVSGNTAVLSTNGSTGSTVRLCGVTAGTTSLTLSTGGRSSTQQITVGASGSFNGVLAMLDPIDVVVGTTVPVNLAVESFDTSWYARSNLQWSVSNTSVLSATGSPTVQQGTLYQVRVTGRALGTSTLTVRADNTTESATVNVVTQLPARRAVLSGGSNLYVGETNATTLQLYDWSGQALSANGRTVTYASSDTAVATVSTAGVVTARGVGAALVTATVDGVTSYPVRYDVLLTPSRIELTPASANIQVGGSVQFTARILSTTGVEITGRTISWRSSNSAVGSVTSGFVRGLATGTTTITASFGSLSATAPVVVGSGATGGGGGSGGGSGGGTQPIVTSCSIAVPVTALDRGGDSGWLSANFGGKLLDVQLTLGTMQAGTAQKPEYQYNLRIRNRGTDPVSLSWAYSLNLTVPTKTSYSSTIRSGENSYDYFFGPPGVNPVWILIQSGCK